VEIWRGSSRVKSSAVATVNIDRDTLAMKAALTLVQVRVLGSK